jgi:hypothetical protein
LNPNSFTRRETSSMSASLDLGFSTMIMSVLPQLVKIKNAAGSLPAASISILATGRRFVRPWLLGSAHGSQWADGGK